MIPTQLTSRLPKTSCFANTWAAALASEMDLAAGILGSPTRDGGGGGTLSSPLFLSGTAAARHNNGLLFGHSDGAIYNKHPRGDEAEAMEEYSRLLKMARGEAMVTPPVKDSPPWQKAEHQQQQHSLFPDGQQMLCFSSIATTNASFPPCDDDGDDGALSRHHQQHLLSVSFAPAANTTHLRNTDLSWKNLNDDLVRARECFTPSQWMELELQAMIYSCIEENAPIPSSLLASIKTCASSPACSTYAAGSLMPTNAFGWGELPLGHSGSDPEPGRCRRTDGKKWRCSKDAVVNHKYCDRHLNRGRHRSRKPVEERSGSAKAPAPRNASSPAASAVSSTGSTVNSCANQLQKNSLPSSPEHSSTHFSRMTVIKDEGRTQHFIDSQACSAPNASSLDQITEEAPLPVRRYQESPEHTADKQFRISSQAFPKNLSRYPSLSSTSFSSFDANGRDCQHNELSALLPNAASDLSTSSSPSQHNSTNHTNTPQLQEVLNLGMLEQQQTSWVPIVSWDAYVGGPLGEALSRAYSNDCYNKASSAQSPDEVLQRSAFNSSSDSAGSSPRADRFVASDLQPSFVDFSRFLSY